MDCLRGTLWAKSEASKAIAPRSGELERTFAPAAAPIVKVSGLVQAFFGSHGTCVSRAQTIVTHGFLTKPGRIGDGAYFWTATEEDHLPLSTLLAERWAERARDKWRLYQDEPDQQVAVVQVVVEVEDDEILYLDEPGHHLDLRMLLSEFATEYFSLTSIFDLTNQQFEKIERILYGIVEGYIKEIEERLEKSIKLIFKCQLSPKRDVISQIVGQASCFSVRDTSCIKDMHWSPSA